MTTILTNFIETASNVYRRGSNAYQQVLQDTPDIYEARALRAILVWLRGPEGQDLSPYVREKIEKIANTALIDVMDRVRDANAFTTKPK